MFKTVVITGLKAHPKVMLHKYIFHYVHSYLKPTLGVSAHTCLSTHPSDTM